MHIVVCGAQTGIGEAFCWYARTLGNEVTALCLSSHQKLQEQGVRVVAPFDVRNPRPIEDLPAIDWLLLNAGIGKEGSLANLDFSSVSDMFEVNALGAIKTYMTFRNRLKNGSKVAITSSVWSSMTLNKEGGHYGYRCSKTALNAFGRSLALDERARGIAVALLHPGFVATGMTGFRGRITPAESVEKLYPLIDGLSMEDSGFLWDYRGEKLPW